MEMEINRESFRVISREFGYKVDALRRHKTNHLVVDLAAVKQAQDDARRRAAEEAHAKELENARAEVAGSMAARLENAASFLDQLREVRSKAASLLDRAESAQDLKAAGTLLRELREQIKLWAELEGKLAAQPQINILVNPQWIELRTLILNALEPYPEAREAVVHAIRK